MSQTIYFAIFHSHEDIWSHA